MSGSDWRNPGAVSRRRAAPSSFLVRSDPMSRRKVAVVGAGMTKFMRRALESPKELAWLAAKSALDSAGMKLNQIDCVVLGSAPDAFDGLHMKGEYLSDGCGGWKKPYLRCYVGGGTGVYAVAQAWFHVASGLFDTRFVVCEEKMSTCLPHLTAVFLTFFDPLTAHPFKPNFPRTFALKQARYIQTYGLPLKHTARLWVKNNHNASGPPAAQLGADLTIKEILASEVMAWP